MRLEKEFLKLDCPVCEVKKRERERMREKERFSERDKIGDKE